MSLVQIPAPRPYSESFATAAISSRSVNGAATRTRPEDLLADDLHLRASLCA
jgi:hypothetical protein